MAKYDVIIIGSGFGGLGAGITLQHNNPKIKTLILEQHTVPGGFVTGFTRKGYYFDGGAEGIMGMGEKEPLRAALREMGFEHEFFRLNPLEVNYFDNGKTLSLYSTKDELINEIKDKFPEDEIKFKQFLDECYRVYSEQHKGNELPDFKNLGFIDFIGRFLDNDYIKDLFNLFCFWFGAKPNELSAIFGASIIVGVLEGGVYYPKGGMLELSKKLADFYIIKGGEIRYKKLVKKILVDDGFVIGVELRDGSQILSDHVISNADVKRTIIEYVGKEHFPEEYISFIKNLKNSVTGIMLFLGLDMNLPNIPSHFQTGMGLDLIEKVHNGDLDFTKLAIRIPTKVDMNLMHNNGHSLIAFIFAPYNWNNYWKSSNDKIRGKEYNDFKNKIGEQMIDQIEKVIPDVRKHIIVKEVATPLTFERYAQVSDGAWFGPFTMQKLPQKETPIKNLYFAGSSTSGSGTSGAMRSGFETARLILDKINGK